MRRALAPPLALLVLVASGAAALCAEPADLSGAFGNTVISLYPDGRTQRIWLHPDGSWEGVNRLGASVSGSWKLKAEKVCLHQSKPLPLPFNYCTEFPAHGAPGVQWAGRDMTGRPIQLTLQAGIQKP